MDTQADSAQILSEEQATHRAREILAFLSELSPANSLGQRQIEELLTNLPNLTENQIVSLGHHDSLCPICFVPLQVVLVEEETAHAMDSPACPVEDLGVTRLQATCGHVFCRKDISKWIRDGHDSCPMCRRPMVATSTVSASSEYGEAHGDATQLLSLVQQLARFQAARGRFSGDDEREYSGMYS